MFHDKKKTLGTIISKFGDKKMSEGGKVPSIAQETEPEYTPKHAHAESMIDAFHNKDPHKLVEAMNSFLNEHEEHEEKDETETSDYSPEK